MIRWSPKKTAWFVVTGLPGLALLPFALSIETAAVGAALGFGTFLFGHTVGLHRGVLHRSFEMSRILRSTLLVGFVLTGLGSPLWWIRAHNQRDHWQNQPTAPDWFRYDHGPLQDAVWNMHTVYVEDREYANPDQLSDPALRLLDRSWLPINLAFFALIAALGGWPHLVISGFLRVWLSLILHWWVGYEAHAHGDLPYPVHGAVESGRNRWLLGIFSLGEGFHNNHHAFPDSAKIGHEPWQFDAGWQVIRAMEALGLAWDVKRPEDVERRGAPPERSSPHGGSPRAHPGRRLVHRSGRRPRARVA